MTSEDRLAARTWARRVCWLFTVALLVAGCRGDSAVDAPPVPKDSSPRVAASAPGDGERPERDVPKFAGKEIPDPPRQRVPWARPTTKLPATFIDATAGLFELGVADPRGCEYREVEVAEWKTEKSRGFVLPARPGDAGRIVVGWDGVLRPVVSLGARADLEADIRALAAALKASRESPHYLEYMSVGVSTETVPGTRTEHRAAISPFFDAQGAATVVPRSPMTMVLLLRLGRADLAESLYASATGWTPSSVPQKPQDEDVSVRSLSRVWADTVYDRLIRSHCLGDDAVALDAARRLDRFAKAVPPRVEAPGVRGGLGLYSRDDPAYVRNPTVVPRLLADHERRAKEGPRTPVPPSGGDRAARIAALIRDFDQIYVNTARSNYTGGTPQEATIVREVVAEGDAAVEPLLAALESDTRLTRCVLSRNGIDRLGPVSLAVNAALVRLLKTWPTLDRTSGPVDLDTAEGRKRLTAAVRAHWEKNRDVPLVERWYRALRDDNAGRPRWVEAASGIVQPAGPNAPLGIRLGIRRPGQPLPAALMGEALRDGRDPSVSELLARRCREIAGPDGPTRLVPDGDLICACSLAEGFTRWDEAGSVATLETLMARCRKRSLDPEWEAHSGSYAPYIAGFALVRARAGDRTGLDEYASWVRTMNPVRIEHSWREVLEPLWTYPEHPALIEATEAMFLAPGSRWLPLVPINDRGDRGQYVSQQLTSPLVGVPAYRQALIKALGDRTKVGTAARKPGALVEYVALSGLSETEIEARIPDADDRPGNTQMIRACDYVAWKLSALDGAPECRLTWRESRRDEAVAACADYLARHGANLAVEYAPDDPTVRESVTQVRFPALGRPATAADVREGRAIFAAPEGAEARVVTLAAGLPFRARWLALKSFPIDDRFARGLEFGGFRQNGWVWQAEEIRTGNRWERFYGFVGPGTIARVAASEIEFSPDRHRGLTLADGLTARVEAARYPGAVFRPGQPLEVVYRPGEPLVMVLRLYNTRGNAQTSPTEFSAPATDGKPALRRGITLAVERFPTGDNPRSVEPARVAPARSAAFDPGARSRMLAPTESFEAMRLDINDWFPGLTPGMYWFYVDFAPQSGLGKGTTNRLQFWIVDPDASAN